MSVRVVKAGALTSLQAGPRNGLRHRGVASGGAADRLSLALANRLVGNPWDTVALECTLLGPTLEVSVPAAVAVAGADCPLAVNGNSVPMHETLTLQPGDRFSVGAARRGVRAYVAFAGGIDVETVLGSASTDLTAGFGGWQGRALQAGDELPLVGGRTEVLATPEKFRAQPGNAIVLRVCPGPEFDALTVAARETLYHSNFVVDQRADRMGVRLGGATLTTGSDGQMPSAAVFPGTIQCPPDGNPFILSVDAGTVGGYPRIAEVARLDRHLLGQLRPGKRVRFQPIGFDDAAEELRAKHNAWRHWLPEIESIV